MIPIIKHQHPAISATDENLAKRVAHDLISEQSILARQSLFDELAVEQRMDGPTLHLDDFSSIALFPLHKGETHFEQRARLRAENGDFVASLSAIVAGYEDYCCDQLGIGSVSWLRPVNSSDSLAMALWQDTRTRQQLLDAVSDGKLKYLHPHIGCNAVWVLAMMLTKVCGTPIKVIAPHPRLADFANDKTCFADLTKRLFGSRKLPPTGSAYNLSGLSRLAVKMSKLAPQLVIKLPDSAGGAGNVVLESDYILGLPIKEVSKVIKPLLARLHWNEAQPLQISAWESPVLCSPSAQVWIPPRLEGGPIIEGLFEQHLSGSNFYGAQAANLCDSIGTELASKSWIMAKTLQHLGYVGRCSFDTVLVGMENGREKLEIIECNGRWGGTSLPMTLMNRLFDGWEKRQFVAGQFKLKDLDQVPFQKLVRKLGNSLYDRRTGRGRIIIHTPGSLEADSRLDAIVLSELEHPHKLEDDHYAQAQLESLFNSA